MSRVATKGVMVLLAAGGIPLAIFETDRTEFPVVATWARDRVFLLRHQGDLTAHGMPEGVEGAVYVEADPWRINMRSIDRPTSRAPRRRSARILPFRRPGETA